MTVNNTQPQNDIENYELKAEQTHSEEMERKEEIEDEFRNSQDGKKLEDVLGEEHNKLFERIVTYYGNRGNIIDAIKNAVEKDAQSLGFVFENETDKDTLIDSLVSQLYGHSIDVESLPEDSDVGLDDPSIYENPMFPVLERYVDRGDLSLHNVEEIFHNLESGVGVKDAFEIDIQNENVRVEIRDLVDQIGSLEDNVAHFKQDFETFKGMPIDIENDEVARIIAENYLKVPDESGQFDVNKDFSTAAKVAANKMLSQFPSIDRTTESFKNAMNVLNDPKHEHDHIKEYKAIKFLFEKISSEKGKGKLRFDQTKYFEKRKNQKIQDAQERFDSIQSILKKAKEAGDKKLQETQLKQAEILKQEVSENNEESSGDVMSGGKEDVLSQIDNLLSEEKA